MLFLNAGLLAGLAAVLVPVILHFWNRRQRKVVDWAAVQFLSESVAARKHKVELEDALLMALRCVLVGLVAAAVARPFVQDNATTPWGLVIPLGLVGLGGLGATTALWKVPRLRYAAGALTMLALALCYGAVQMEERGNKARLGEAGRQDIAIILDLSYSMDVRHEDKSAFHLAVAEARSLIEESPDGNHFAVIGAGPVPVVLADLTRDRRSLEEALGAAATIQGGMQGFAALELALETLAAGSHPNKKLVVFTDGQSRGWETGNAARWEALAARMKRLPFHPQLILRELEFPPEFRNVAVRGVELSREVLRPDEVVGVEVVLENTGFSSVTPRAVELQVGETVLTSAAVDQLAPGQEARVPFEVSFERGGSHLLEARVLVDDDLAADDDVAHAVFVAGVLRVLVVDEALSGRILDQDSGYLRLILEEREGEEGSKRDLAATFIGRAKFNEQVPSLASYHVVVLAGVATLDAEMADVLGEYVLKGGGLIVVPGATADPKSYNKWEVTGRRVLPGLMIKREQYSRIEDGIRPVPVSFADGPLDLVSDEVMSDLGRARFSQYWKLARHKAAEQAGTVAGSLSNGDPLVLTGKLGEGTVFLHAAALNAKDSSLATREIFVPYVLELLSAAATQSGYGLNLDPSSPLQLVIARQRPGDRRAEAFLDELAVALPDGTSALSPLVMRSGEVWLEVPWRGMVGPYRTQLPASIQDVSPLDDAEGFVSFTVRRDGAESRVELLKPEDLAVIDRHLTLYEAASVAEILQVLAGKGLGRELWKLLVVAAMILFVGEALLTRWIARRRRSGEVGRIVIPESGPAVLQQRKT